MNLKIYPSRFILDNNFAGSTLLAHQYFIASWLTKESIIFDNVPDNKDIQSTLSFFKLIGKEIVYLDKNSLYIKNSNEIKNEEIILDVKDSLSSCLLLLPVSLQTSKKVIFDCSENFIDEVCSYYEKILPECNLSLRKNNNTIFCSGTINLDYLQIDDNVNYLFIIGLIINALYQKKAITINLIDSYIFKNKIIESISILKRFGFDITFTNNTIFTHNNFNFKWDNIYIEADYLDATPFLMLSCLNGSFISSSFIESSIQSNKVVIEQLKSIGGNIKFISENNTNKLYIINNSLFEKGYPKQLKAQNYNLIDCYDQSLYLMTISAFAMGYSNFTNLNSLDKDKKNKILKLCEVLKLLNVDILVNNEKVVIKGKKEYSNRIMFDDIKDIEILKCICMFALINKGEITINNIDILYNDNFNFFDILISSVKDGSIQLI